VRGDGWRGLAVFWTAVLLVAAGVGVTLQSLGPPAPPPPSRTADVTPPAATSTPAPTPPVPPGVAVQPAAAKPAFMPPGRATPGPIDDPDPLLLEPARAGDGAMLPRFDITGRGPMQAYARGFDRTTLRPRVGLIMAGVGASDPDSQDTIRTLPGGVTLAVSPYTLRPASLLEAARIAGHEVLLSLPLDSSGDAAGALGDHALLAAAAPSDNADRLDWLMSRFAGYAGVTDAFGTLRGDRFAIAPQAMTSLLDAIGARGLFYVEARPGTPLPPGVWAADIDVIVDETPVRSEIDARLAMLETLARQRGWALGLAGTPRPITTARIADWANGLPAKGLVLAPASAMVQLPTVRPTDRPPAGLTGARK